jgi:hypothetical protein
MAGYTGEKRWNGDDGGISSLASGVCVNMVETLTQAEAAYAELTDLYTYAGGTVQLLADLLFTDDIAARTTPGTNAVITVDVPATKAQIDFGTTAGGIVDSVAIVDGGAGYTTGGSFNITVASDGGWVAGTEAVITYTISGGVINGVVVTDGGTGYSASLAATTDVAAGDITAPVGGVLSNPQISVAGTGYTDGNYNINITLTNSTPNSGRLSYTVDGGVVTAVSILTAASGYPLGTGQIVTSFPLAGGVSDTTANADELAKAQALFDAITALHELYLAADNNAVATEDRLAQLRRMT